MLFFSFRFLIFLPVVFAIFWGVLRSRGPRLTFLLLASYVFYMSWNPKLIILLWGSTTLDFYTVRAMGRTDDQRLRRLLLGISVAFNLSILAAFKYANFFVENANWFLGHLGAGVAFPGMNLALPLGISFYTFETISYAIDGYYRQSTTCKSLRDYGLFIAFFPHLIAGPIVRPEQFVPQLDAEKRLTGENVSAGMFLFLFGLVKKLIIADRLAVFADLVFGNPHAYGPAGLWLGAVAYAGQIYCDFSGYSLMALGLARLFDFTLPANFRTPYLSRNISEFWRRWHVTLSTWLRDYLYASLRRVWNGEFGVWGGLALTMLLGGLWHGASWTFVAWGAYHGLLLVAHRLLNRKGAFLWRPIADRLPGPVKEVVARLLVFAFVCAGWVLFRAQTLREAAFMLGRMLRPGSGGAALPPSVDVVAALLGLIFLLDLVEWNLEERGRSLGGLFVRAPSAVRVVVYAGALFLFIAFLPAISKPFIYFQF